MLFNLSYHFLLNFTTSSLRGITYFPKTVIFLNILSLNLFFGLNFLPEDTVLLLDIAYFKSLLLQNR